MRTPSARTGRMGHVVGATALAGALVLSACGDGSSGSDAERGSATARPSSTTTAPSPSASDPAAGGIYLALGDSLAAGYQPGGTELRDTAYPALAASRLGRDGGRLDVQNLACSGETAASLVRGGRCDYPGGSQLAQAETVLRDRGGDRDADVELVTIDIGGNDLLRCARGVSVDQACVATGLASVRSALPTTLQRLRAAAGTDVPVLVIGYYNPWLAAGFLGFGDAQIAPAAKAFAALDAAIEQAARGAGATYVSLDDAFALDDTTPTTFAGREVPRNVAQVCALTFVCTARDIHLSEEGAATVAREVADAATKAGVG
ncbi:MAG: SGNH/GDSL hydrolase family protein [Dermatophilaceae bacterium]